MDYLLDTHIILWYLQGDIRLTPIIENLENQLYVSMASLWEISIKVGLGKLSLDNDLSQLKPSLIENDFKIIYISFSDVIAYKSLPLINNHRDPFDRMLISQAINRSLILISHDTQFCHYSGLELSTL
ncbi:MAG: type II toxin-antitoxin system VapC family toxin [Snowella sp.]|nr:type II toxin-antitoxin system VapC family toxin [Snowella sp.]